MKKWLLVLLVALLAGACGDDSSQTVDGPPPEDEETPNNDPMDEDVTDPEEEPAQGWVPGVSAFKESSLEWGLEPTQIYGTQLAVADIDNDGYADLVVRQGSRSDDFGPEGRRWGFVLRNNGQGQFEDVTVESGLRATRSAPDGVLGHPGEVFAFADVDNDGDLDAYAGTNTTLTSRTVEETSEIFINDGNGVFAPGPEGSETRRAVDVPAGAAFTDFDRDGWVDLWVSQNAPQDVFEPLQDRLYQGNGDGHFVDVTVARGLETYEWSTPNLNNAQAHSRGWSAGACDINGDGTPELLASSYGRAPNHLYQGKEDNRGVSFVNRSISSGYAFDQNQDWSDNQSARCFCQLNPNEEGCDADMEPPVTRCENADGHFRWRHTSDREPYRLGGVSATAVCTDINNDGHMDLLATELVHWDVGSNSDSTELLLNNGQDNVRFVRPGNDLTGLTRTHAEFNWNEGHLTAAVFDFDNDGWPDIYLGDTDYPDTRGLLYHQDSRGKFSQVSLEDGIDHQRSHGVAVADFDRDGDLDLIVGHSRARCDSFPEGCFNTPRVRFFENIVGNQRHWIQLRLEGGPGTNRSAIGARVTVEAGGITQTQEVNGGHGHYGIQQDMTLHFGLGDAEQATVTVRWPDADLTTETFTITGDQRYHVLQGAEPTPDIAP